MNKNPLSDGREIPLDNGALQSMLANGPSAPTSTVSGEIPPMPQVELPVTSAEESETSSPIVNEGPNEDMRKNMILPSDKEKANLKARYGMLRVVPMPYTREDNKVQTYVLRKLTRSQWRAMEEASGKIAESKPGIPPMEIFQEKIVSMACVWPALPEHEISASPPGLVPTLFAIIQQMGLFFDPEAIMNLSFVL